MLRSRLYEFVFFVGMYPKGLWILLIGCFMSGVLATVGSHELEEFASIPANILPKELILGILIDKYKHGVLLILGSAAWAAIRQFRIDYKKFETRF